MSRKSKNQFVQKTQETSDRIKSDRKLKKHLSKSGEHFGKAAGKVAHSKNRRKAVKSKKVKKNLRSSADHANKALIRYQNPPQTKKKLTTALAVVIVTVAFVSWLASRANSNSDY